MKDFGDGDVIDGYDRINVLLGKNGAGKSTLLRNIDRKLYLASHAGCVRYITPERGGDLTYDGNIESNRAQSPEWFGNVRRFNRFEQFRQSSVAEFRNLETLVLRSIESNDEIRKSDFKFDAELARMNKVLDRVSLTRRDSAGFDIVHRATSNTEQPNTLSSGESELISLSIEILLFCYLCKQNKYKETENWLLLDEPDVHLHPDLQHRLMELLVEGMEGANGRVIIATHSTTILSSLCDTDPNMRVGFKRPGNNAVTFRSADNIIKNVLPIFGAHPLSNTFNQKPPLLVEGEDDERIWQSAVRASAGRISVYPCVAGDIQSLSRYEAEAGNLISSVYDNARAYSLRDRDDDPYNINDIGPVTRCRLYCRAAENLIVTDDTLAELETDWTSLKQSLEKWIGDNPEHVRYADAIAFRDSGWDRRGFNLKNLRMVLIGITGSSKPWEVAVGRAIGKMNERRFSGDFSLEAFLGPKLVEAINLLG